ncbi:MAG: hypothetical protein JWM78_1871, partial [Verrucomicrobiaceae bacterium]|nr:hypothetical protein [Verrucomicrobiaceae bacterium]
ILTDWMMPKMDGVELCGKLRANEKTRGIPIILSTAAGIMPEGLGTLFDAFLPKLRGIDHLLETLRQLIGS